MLSDELRDGMGSVPTPLRLCFIMHTLDRINNIHAIERTLSEYLVLRVELVYWRIRGELAVIDFKTSDKIKPEKWLENYFVQEMFYPSAYYGSWYSCQETYHPDGHTRREVKYLTKE